MSTIRIGTILYVTRQEMCRIKADMAFPTQEKYYTVGEVSKITGIPYQTLYSRIRSQSIKAYKRPNTDFWWISETNLKKLQKSVDKGIYKGIQ